MLCWEIWRDKVSKYWRDKEKQRCGLARQIPGVQKVSRWGSGSTTGLASHLYSRSVLLLSYCDQRFAAHSSWRHLLFSLLNAEIINVAVFLRFVLLLFSENAIGIFLAKIREGKNTESDNTYNMQFRICKLAGLKILKSRRGPSGLYYSTHSTGTQWPILFNTFYGDLVVYIVQHILWGPSGLYCSVHSMGT